MQEAPAAVGLFDDRGSLAHAAKQGAGGEGGIRTPDTVNRMPHFECGAFTHSAHVPVLITLHFSSVADPVDNAAATQLLPFTARATALCSPCVQRRPAFSDPRVVRLPVACPAAHGNRDPA